METVMTTGNLDFEEKLFSTMGKSGQEERGANGLTEGREKTGFSGSISLSTVGGGSTVSTDDGAKSQKSVNFSVNRSLQAPLTTQVIMLTTRTQRGLVEASVLLNPASGMSCTSPLTSMQLCNLHSLAQANLISDTQEQIVKQLSAHEAKEAGINPLVHVATSTINSTSGCIQKGVKKEKVDTICEADRLEKMTSLGKTSDHKEVPRQLTQRQIAIIEPRPNEPKSFVCSVRGCGRKFAWPAHFKYHQLTHTNDRRHMCEMPGCGKRFMTAQSLQVHSRTHTGEKPFVCPAEDCGKSFTTAGNLKNHSRVHTGEKPFSCEQCGRRFAEYSSLHKHSLTHTGAKPFSCEICGKSFSQSGSRRVHMNRHKMEEAKQALLAAQVTASLTDADQSKNVKVEAPSDVLVLCNSQDDNVQYQDLQNPESVVFPQGLDHIVTVTTQPAEGENEPLGMTHDILGAEEVLGDDQIVDAVRVGSSVVVLSQPSDMESLASSYHHNHEIPNGPRSDTGDYNTGSRSNAGDYDSNQLIHTGLHHEEIASSDEHGLTYTSLNPPSQDGHDRQIVAEEIEVGVSSSSSNHPQSTQNIHMDPMMESDEESDSTEKHNS